MGNKKATKVEAAPVAIKARNLRRKRRAETVWSQIEASLKQIEIGGTEVECFKSFKRQEEMAASWKKNLEEEVIKQKETEKNLQARYGNLLSTLEKAEEIMVGFRAQALNKLMSKILTNGESNGESTYRFLLLFFRWWSSEHWNN